MMRFVMSLGFAACLSAGLIADTLVLRNGTRIEGQLVFVSNGIVEFEERGGFGRSRRVQVNVEDVARIEFARASDGRERPGGRPFGLRERTAIVNSNTPWSDTSVDVRAGQTVYFEADGEVRWGRDRRDGPGGEDNSPMNPNRPMPNRPAVALIGKIGRDSTDYFFIGAEPGPIRMRASGRLFLGVNDDFLNDNAGTFRVVIYH